MPELPEVETVRRGLAAKLVGRRLTRVDQRRPDLRFAMPERLGERLTGRLVQAIDRRAKYMLVRLDDGMVLMIHLGMSGRMLLRGRDDQASPPDLDPHDHLVFETDDGTVVTFNDARRFGMVDLVSDNAIGEHRLLRWLGPEPLDEAFTQAVLSAALAGKRTPIKAALLDQRVVAGLGNIYVCEALFEAGLSPRRSAHTVVGARAARLVPAIKQVLRAAIAAGGSSLRDYVQTSGELGYFQHAWRVYGREGQPCRAEHVEGGIGGGDGGNGGACGATIRRIVQSGRSSFYCPRCQR